MVAVLRILPERLLKDARGGRGRSRAELEGGVGGGVGGVGWAGGGGGSRLWGGRGTPLTLRQQTPKTPGLVKHLGKSTARLWD